MIYDVFEQKVKCSRTYKGRVKFLGRKIVWLAISYFQLAC